MGSIVEKSYYCYGPHYEIGVAHTVGLCIVQIRIAHCRTYINWLLTTAARRKFLTKKTWYISLQKVKRKLFKSKNSILGIKPEKYSMVFQLFKEKDNAAVQWNCSEIFSFSPCKIAIRKFKFCWKYTLQIFSSTIITGIPCESLGTKDFSIESIFFSELSRLL